MSARRPLLLGEGVRDIGRPDRHRKCGGDHEGDLPRLLRRVTASSDGPAMFGYAASTLREIVERFPASGRPMRRGGKAKELRDAVLASVTAHSIVIALIDARADEVGDLRHDVREILEQCRERAPDTAVAIGLAVHEIEIWMLADPDARVAAFGETVGRRPVPSDLEAVRDPKSLWTTLAGQCNPMQGLDPEDHRDLQRAKAWEALRLDVVSTACPTGFAPFLADARVALSRL